MKAFTKGLVVLFLIGSFVLILKKYQPDLSIVYPDHCKFTIDNNLSRSEHVAIKSFIDGCYKKDKDPSHLLVKIEENFPSIKSITVDMDDPDFLRFTIHGYRPLFVLNENLIVCEQGKVFEKNIFAIDVIAQLKAVVFTLKQGKNDIQKLASFVDVVSSRILESFYIRWLGKHRVWLEQKGEKQLALLVDHLHVPTIGDVEQCEKIKSQMYDASKKRKNITWVCDLRFKDQVVVFSTKKGE